MSITLGSHFQYIQRCIFLAQKGLGSVSPNPMVGSILVYQNRIISEGWHQQFGKEHAEANAIDGIDNDILQKCTLYVSLEPCAHYGKTPPCAQLIIDKKIPNVVIAVQDIFKEVSGKGIEMLKKAGVKVRIGTLEKESSFMNRRFNTYHQKKRPYIILKWAETKDGFMHGKNDSEKQISGNLAQKINHQWRSEEDAILIGKNTLLMDNPSLTTRLVKGKNPNKYILANDIEKEANLKIFDEAYTTVLGNKDWEMKKGRGLKMNDSKNLLEVLEVLYKDQIQSVIIEGGATILDSFIGKNLYDEVRVLKSKKIEFNAGLKAPNFESNKFQVCQDLGEDEYFNYIK